MHPAHACMTLHPAICIWCFVLFVTTALEAADARLNLEVDSIERSFDAHHPLGSNSIFNFNRHRLRRFLHTSRPVVCAPPTFVTRDPRLCFSTTPSRAENPLSEPVSRVRHAPRPTSGNRLHRRHLQLVHRSTLRRNKGLPRNTAAHLGIEAGGKKGSRAAGQRLAPSLPTPRRPVAASTSQSTGRRAVTLGGSTAVVPSDPHALAAATPGPWSVHVRVEYSPLLGALVVVCAVAIYLVWTRRYSHKVGFPCLPMFDAFAHLRSQDLASANKDQMAGCEVIEIRTEGARRLEQASNCFPAEREVVPAATPIACYFATQAELFAACAQSSSFTIDCSDLWDIPPVEAYRSLHFRVTPPADRRAAIAPSVATSDVRLFSPTPPPPHKQPERRPAARARAPPRPVGRSAFGVGRLSRCAERAGWTAIDVGRFLRHAEAVRLDASKAADHIPPEADNAHDPIAAFPGSPLLSQEWYLRKKRPAQKTLKRTVVPTRPPKEVSRGRSSRARSALRTQSDEAAALALADAAREPERDEDGVDEIDNERELETGGATFHKHDIDETRPEAGDQNENRNDAVQRCPPPPSVTSEAAGKSRSAEQHHPPPCATAAATAKDIGATADPNAQADHKPNRKPKRRGGMSARVAKRKALEAQQQRDAAASEQYAARRHDILGGEVLTHRVSGAWLVPEASPDVWARTYPPHVAQSYPAPPSGSKPDKKSDALRQRRHGRVKPFLGKVPYPTKPVVVLGHEVRYASDVRARCGEERRARSMVMDRRRERCKESEYIDHLLVPLKPKIGDVSPELTEIVAEYEEAEATKAAAKAAAAAAAAADAPQVHIPPSPAVRSESISQHQHTPLTSCTPAEVQTPNHLRSSAAPTTSTPHTESPDSSGTAHRPEDPVAAHPALDGPTSPRAQSVSASAPCTLPATPSTAVAPATAIPAPGSSADPVGDCPSLAVEFSPAPPTNFTVNCSSCLFPLTNPDHGRDFTLA
ncbi:uncharacterized protein PHACADRAFT_186128 [Phanerochaete carnosa HHB-10118-sp]|uniref:Uncharacterized protein n=1 Tax=Phanerochaete carnosa (strain HHB-10118-sp) TaxID=650164 RepID=K5WSR9_PHACS|nr:uncharacterized protein PHACADRAFT_186128 [Phanerochaete carnosa HHB-10118-sp]EKM53457.1 hypothetical protein PHACADRAFT_186128 [Phanerochaete carnosa HHB-10118-sp]